MKIGVATTNTQEFCTRIYRTCLSLHWDEFAVHSDVVRVCRPSPSFGPSEEHIYFHTLSVLAGTCDSQASGAQAALRDRQRVVLAVRGWAASVAGPATYLSMAFGSLPNWKASAFSAVSCFTLCRPWQEYSTVCSVLISWSAGNVVRMLMVS